MYGLGNANIVHWASTKSNQVTRSVLAAELYGMVLGFNNVYVMKQFIETILGQHVQLRVYTDSNCLFQSLTTLNITADSLI